MDRKNIDLMVGIFMLLGVTALLVLALRVGNLGSERVAETYVVEARLPAGMSRSEAASWRARLDGLLPPWQDVLYVNPDLQPIHDPRILGLLEQPYCGKDQRGSDYNLGSRIEALYAFIDAAQFESLCREVRARSEASLLRAKSALADSVLALGKLDEPRALIVSHARVWRPRKRKRSRRGI